MALSTLQKKQLVAVTGLGLVGFVIAHLTGNFLIFKGADALNDYATFLHDLGGGVMGGKNWINCHVHSAHGINR